MEPPAADMLRTLKRQPSRALFRTVTAVAGCRAGQRCSDWPEKQHGLFAWCLAEAYAGRADVNHDGRVEPTELSGFLQKAMAQGGAELKVVQNAELFLPDDRPPRLSVEAKKSIRRLAAFLGQSKIDADAAGREYRVAAEQAGKEIEPRLLYGLVLTKLKDRDAAIKQLEELKSDQPDLLPALEALTFLRFDKRSYVPAVTELAGLVGKTPSPKSPASSTPPRPSISFIGPANCGVRRPGAARRRGPVSRGQGRSGCRRHRPWRRCHGTLPGREAEVGRRVGRLRSTNRSGPGRGHRRDPQGAAAIAGELHRLSIREAGSRDLGRTGVGIRGLSRFLWHEAKKWDCPLWHGIRSPMENNMPAEETPQEPVSPAGPPAAGTAKPMSVWPAVAMIALFWAAPGCRLPGQAVFRRLSVHDGPSALLTLAFFVWWWTNRRYCIYERLAGFVFIVGPSALVVPCWHRSIGWFGLLAVGLPIVLTAWTLWLIAQGRWPALRNRPGALLVVAVPLACLALVRSEGLDAGLHADVHFYSAVLLDKPAVAPCDGKRMKLAGAMGRILGE